MPHDISPALKRDLPLGLPPMSLSADLRHKIAAELDAMRKEMEELGVELCLNEEVMLRCMTKLQHLDEMGQRCHWLAELIRSDNPEAVIPDISLQALVDRLGATKSQ